MNDRVTHKSMRQAVQFALSVGPLNEVVDRLLVHINEYLEFEFRHALWAAEIGNHEHTVRCLESLLQKLKGDVNDKKNC